MVRALVSLLCLGGLSTRLDAEEPKYEPVDAKTIAAYEKLGAKYGGVGFTDFNGMQFLKGARWVGKRIPAFEFGYMKEIPELPRSTCLSGSS
jgi:hypothetical protein